MANICKKCGKENRDNVAFCAQCGEKLAAQEQIVDEFETEPTMRAKPAQTKPVAQQSELEPVSPPPPPVAPVANTKKVKAEKAPGTITFLLYRIVFSIPIIGLVMSLFCSFIGRNKAIKHYARATFIWGVAWLAVFAVLVFIAYKMVNGAVAEANATVSGLRDKLGIFFDIISQKLTNTSITIS